MAPESVRDGLFSVETDVWSYGVVLWEIWTYAELPFSSMTNQEVSNGLVGGRILLEQPAECPDLCYRIMRDVCLAV